MKDVFISYSFKNSEYVDQIQEEMNKRGITSWRATRHIGETDRFSGEIVKAIRECNLFLLVMSKAAQESQNVLHEISYADKKRKYIVPFFVEPCDINDDFEYYLSGKTHFHAHEDFQAAMDKLEETLKKLKETGYGPEPVFLKCRKCECGSLTLKKEPVIGKCILWMIRIVCAAALVLLVVMLPMVAALRFVLMVLESIVLEEPILATGLWELYKYLLNVFTAFLKKTFTTRKWYIRCNNCGYSFTETVSVEAQPEEMIYDLTSAENRENLEA